MARGFGLKFVVTPRTGDAGVEVEEGISAVRLLLPRCWFGQERCQAGIDALMSYHRDYNVKLNEFKATPVHDWASHVLPMRFEGLRCGTKPPPTSARSLSRLSRLQPHGVVLGGLTINEPRYYKLPMQHL